VRARESDDDDRPDVTVEVTDATRSGPNADVVAQLVAHVLRAEGAVPAEVGVAFVGERRIRQLNREHRGIDSVTDVLSFPLEEAGEWDEADRRAADEAEAAEAELGQATETAPSGAPGETDEAGRSLGEDDEPPRLLGDVVICVRRADKQAAADGNPRSFELALLLVHGLLHLLGWEHDEQPGPMALRQAVLLNDFDWTRLE
jgi:probable rRNA maturation factor